MTREERKEAVSHLAVQVYEILTTEGSVPLKFLRTWAFENLKDHVYHHLPGHLIEVCYQESESGKAIVLKLSADPSDEMSAKDSQFLEDIESGLSELSGLPIVRERKRNRA